MNKLVIETYLIYNSQNQYIGEYRICPNCLSKIIPRWNELYEEEMYGVCVRCGHDLLLPILTGEVFEIEERVFKEQVI